MAEGDFITVSLDAWNQMLEDCAFLAALEAVGVDNWEGYETACQLHNGDITEEDI